MKQSLVFLHSFSTWQIGLIAVCSLAFLMFSFFALRRVRAWWKMGVLFLLRVLALGLCVFIVFQPGIETAKIITVRDRIAILVDTSESMSLPAYPEKKTRIDTVKAFLSGAADLLDSLKKEHDLEAYAFSGGAKRTLLEKLTLLEAHGKTTDLAAAVRDIEKAQGQALGGILLFSDGNDHGEIGRAFESLPSEGRLAFESPVPIYAFGPGDQKAFKDIGVKEVRSGGFGFIKTPMEVLVRVRAHGYSTKVPVVLKREGEIIASRLLDLTRDKKDYEVSLGFTPQEGGRSIYSVEVPPLADEAVTDNNSMSFIVNVVRDKTRILQIAGRPSWDERFLRQLLKNDPGIDLVSFMILRTPSSLVTDIRSFPIPVEELSLIPFPTVDIFEKGLPSFDVVIFQNFDYRPYAPFFYLNFLKAYVDNGGAFIMTGGDQSFSSGGYGGTPAEDVLPVTLERTGRVSEEEFSLSLTRAGQDHPIMKLDLDRKKNEKLWSSVPMLSGFNRVQGVRPGAMTLAEGPGSAPIISIREAGKGRTLAVATESLWTWAFSPGGERHYRTFWKNAIAWLVKDPGLRRVRVLTEKDTYQKNEEVSLEVFAQDASYRPLKGARVEVELIAPSKASTILRAVDKGEGRYELQFKPEESGVYRAKVRIHADVGQGFSLAAEEGETAFAVEGRNIELEDLSIKEGLLRELAELSGGRYFALPSRASEVKIAFPPPVRVSAAEKEKRPIWNSPVFYLPAVFLLCIEWFFRRRWSFP